MVLYDLFNQLYVNGLVIVINDVAESCHALQTRGKVPIHDPRIAENSKLLSCCLGQTDPAATYYRRRQVDGSLTGTNDVEDRRILPGEVLMKFGRV